MIQGWRRLARSVPINLHAVPNWCPAGVAYASERIDAADLDERAAAVGIAVYRENVVERRRREFLAGRLAARQALKAAGAGSLVVGRNGSAPLWPDDTVGSISHSGAVAAAVVAPRPCWRALGLDIEGLIQDRRIAVVQRVMRPGERSAAQTIDDPWIWTRIWCAKEAAYKCLSALGVDADLADLVPHWQAPGRGSLLAWVDAEAVQLALHWQRQESLLWMLASLPAQ